MKMASRQEVEMVRTTKIVRTRWWQKLRCCGEIKESRCEGNQQGEASRGAGRMWSR